MDFVFFDGEEAFVSWTREDSVFVGGPVENICTLTVGRSIISMFISGNFNQISILDISGPITML